MFWAHFDNCIFGVIGVNTLILALDGYFTSPTAQSALALLNFACTAIFVLEAVVKISAVGLGAYWSEPWNVFDGTVVACAIADWVVTLMALELGTNPTLMRALRMVRVTRVLRTLRVVKSMRGLKMLLTMLAISLPGLVNILGIFLLLLTMYSLLAMQLFGHVAHGEFLHDEANFCTFSAASLTMFRSATGESWNGMMHDVMVQEDDEGACDEAAGTCGTWLAIPFFVSYVLASTYIVLKMMIALILDNFLLALKRDRRSLQIEHADAFVEAWSHFDRDATGRMPARYLVKLLRDLPPPLGLDPTDYPAGYIRATDFTRYAFNMHLRPRWSDATRTFELTFTEVLACLAKDAYRLDEDDDLAEQLQRAEELEGTVQGRWLRAQQRARRRRLRMEGGHSWEKVLPAGGKSSANILKLLKINDVRTSAPEANVLAQSIATSVIANFWRDHQGEQSKLARLHLIAQLAKEHQHRRGATKELL